MLRFLIVFVMAMLFPFSISSIVAFGESHEANETAWNFTGDNQPSYEEIWASDLGVDVRRCGNGRLDDLYENYAILHPEYRPLMDGPDLRKHWRMSLIPLDNHRFDAVSDCFYSMLRDRWLAGSSDDRNEKIIFCGIVTERLEEPELSAALAVEELAFYGFNGSSSALRFVLDTSPSYSQVRLNDDVRYIAQLVFNVLIGPKGPIRERATRYLSPSAGDLLTDERKALVEDAFERNDYQAVLDTTRPC